jgi:glycosyltransferase involved in cell wall biosynthesis
MRIGIDVKLLRTNSAGIKVYLENLLDELQRIDRQNEYILFSPAPVAYPLFAPNFSYAIFPTRLPGILWQQYELPKHAQKQKIDVFWGPEQTLFLRRPKGIQKVLTVHDFVYRRYPKTMQRSVRAITGYYGTRSLKKSDTIVCISKFTAQELHRLYPSIPEHQIRTIPNGIVHDNTVQEPLPKKDFLFFSGSMEPRKNLRRLLKALESLAKKGIRIPLKIAGPTGWHNKAFRELLESSPIRDSIEILGFVSPEELRNLYKSCKAFVFPTLYEGFGLPALEALQNGARVLTSKDSPMQEFLGSLGIYFDPHDSDSIARAIETLYLNPEKISYSEKENEKRLSILKRYTWEHAAKKMKAIFEKIHAEAK